MRTKNKTLKHAHSDDQTTHIYLASSVGILSSCARSRFADRQHPATAEIIYEEQQHCARKKKERSDGLYGFDMDCVPCCPKKNRHQFCVWCDLRAKASFSSGERLLLLLDSFLSPHSSPWSNTAFSPLSLLALLAKHQFPVIHLNFARIVAVELWMYFVFFTPPPPTSISFWQDSQSSCAVRENHIYSYGVDKLDGGF